MHAQLHQTTCPVLSYNSLSTDYVLIGARPISCKHISALGKLSLLSQARKVPQNVSTGFKPRSTMLVLQILIDNHMLTADEEVRLRQGLKFSQDDRWLALLYQ